MPELTEKTIEEQLSQLAYAAVMSNDSIGSTVPGPIVKAPKSKELYKGIVITAVKDDKVFHFDLYLSVKYGTVIPQTAFLTQEKLKSATDEFCNEKGVKIEKINIHVQGVDFNR